MVDVFQTPKYKLFARFNLVSLSVRATEGDLVSLRARAFSERSEKSTGSEKLLGSDLPTKGILPPNYFT